MDWREGGRAGGGAPYLADGLALDLLLVKLVDGTLVQWTVPCARTTTTTNYSVELIYVSLSFLASSQPG